MSKLKPQALNSQTELMCVYEFFPQIRTERKKGIFLDHSLNSFHFIYVIPLHSFSVPQPLLFYAPTNVFIVPYLHHQTLDILRIIPLIHIPLVMVKGNSKNSEFTLCSFVPISSFGFFTTHNKQSSCFPFNLLPSKDSSIEMPNPLCTSYLLYKEKDAERQS